MIYFSPYDCQNNDLHIWVPCALRSFSTPLIGCILWSSSVRFWIQFCNHKVIKVTLFKFLCVPYSKLKKHIRKYEYFDDVSNMTVSLQNMTVSLQNMTVPLQKWSMWIILFPTGKFQPVSWIKTQKIMISTNSCTMTSNVIFGFWRYISNNDR